MCFRKKREYIIVIAITSALSAGDGLAQQSGSTSQAKVRRDQQLEMLNNRISTELEAKRQAFLRQRQQELGSWNSQTRTLLSHLNAQEAKRRTNPTAMRIEEIQKEARDLISEYQKAGEAEREQIQKRAALLVQELKELAPKK